ncbi:putative ABC transporter, ATP binding protein [Aeropyrum pernix]|uniref:Putative ABC transporter, ATP binding protein n=1 Tax=Aeropyrum pernix TaxID=56636 RepID=A0A401HBD3_AERPX|nr:putative ABC transporter, ATP binding protein [Aeropyrum pernix]
MLKPCSVRLEGVEARYNTSPPVLRGLSFSLDPGSLVALLGPNGSGKTTLLRLLAGIIKPSRGRVEVCGSPPGRVRRMLGYAPASPEVDHRLRAVEVALLYRYGVSEGVAWGRRDWEEVLAALGELGVGELAWRSWGELSSGQRRLVILAGVLARRPGLALLDEPHSFLDVSNMRRVTLVLRSLRARATVVYTTHDPLAAMAADTVIMLREGLLHAQGPPEAVVTPETIEEVYGIPADRLDGLTIPRYYKP